MPLDEQDRFAFARTMEPRQAASIAKQRKEVRFWFSKSATRGRKALTQVGAFRFSAPRLPNYFRQP